MGIDADLSAQGFVEVGNVFEGTSASIDTYVNFQDRYRLVGEGTIPFGSTLLNLSAEGIFGGSVNDPAEDQIVAEASFVDRATNDEYLFAKYEYGFNTQNTGESGASALFSISQLLGPDQDAEFNGGLRIKGFVNGGTLSIGFGNTMKLESITFPDGTTPEQHGFQIVFDSGLISPNLDEFLTTADTDLNGRVDGRDFLRWQRGAGITSDALSIDGDTDGDGDVDGEDLMKWSDQYGLTALAISQASTVPEPNCLLLLVSTALGGSWLRLPIRHFD